MVIKSFMQISSFPACRRLLFLLLHAEKEIGDVNAGKYQVKAALYSVGYSDAGVYNFRTNKVLNRRPALAAYFFSQIIQNLTGTATATKLKQSIGFGSKPRALYLRA